MRLRAMPISRGPLQVAGMAMAPAAARARVNVWATVKARD